MYIINILISTYLSRINILYRLYRLLLTGLCNTTSKRVIRLKSISKNKLSNIHFLFLT